MLHKDQNPFTIKTLSKETEGYFLNLIMGIYTKPTANIILHDERLKVFSLKIRDKQKCLLSPLLFNIILEVISRVILGRKKAIQFGKEEVKLSVCR